ncbi:MAG TPA: hypothetical protein VNP98_03385 [Chthoniobacterales bacterium]|nr:hypothetical protein [Chthoniobacterales bacterium]
MWSARVESPALLLEIVDFDETDSGRAVKAGYNGGVAAPAEVFVGGMPVA